MSIFFHLAGVHESAAAAAAVAVPIMMVIYAQPTVHAPSLNAPEFVPQTASTLLPPIPDGKTMMPAMKRTTGGERGRWRRGEEEEEEEEGGADEEDGGG